MMTYGLRHPRPSSSTVTTTRPICSLFLLFEHTNIAATTDTDPDLLGLKHGIASHGTATPKRTMYV